VPPIQVNSSPKNSQIATFPESASPQPSAKPPAPKTDTWMALYIGDYLADTTHLGAEESGAYLHLLMHYWRTGPLVDDLDRLVTISKLRGPDARSIAQALRDEFFTKHGDGRWHQKRADREIAIWQGKRLKAQEKARSAAGKRWGKDAPRNAPSMLQAMPQAMLEQCPLPSPSPLPLPLPSPSTAPSGPPHRGKEKSPPRSGPGTLPSAAPNAFFQKPITEKDDARRIAKAVVEGTSITSPFVFDRFVEQAELELKAHPGKIDEISGGMIGAWKEYQACAKARKLRTTPMGSERFFGDGIWKTSSMWGLKKDPMAKMKFSNAEPL
jgi:uncharacterized protein YdaU (DUF1376 family)